MESADASCMSVSAFSAAILRPVGEITPCVATIKVPERSLLQSGCNQGEHMRFAVDASVHVFDVMLC